MAGMPILRMRKEKQLSLVGLFLTIYVTERFARCLYNLSYFIRLAPFVKVEYTLTIENNLQPIWLTFLCTCAETELFLILD